MDKPNHWVKNLIKQFYPTAGFVHIWPKFGLKQKKQICDIDHVTFYRQSDALYKLVEFMQQKQRQTKHNDVLKFMLVFSSTFHWNDAENINCDGKKYNKVLYCNTIKYIIIKRYNNKLLKM